MILFAITYIYTGRKYPAAVDIVRPVVEVFFMNYSATIIIFKKRSSNLRDTSGWRDFDDKVCDAAARLQRKTGGGGEGASDLVAKDIFFPPIDIVKSPSL